MCLKDLSASVPDCLSTENFLCCLEVKDLSFLNDYA